MQGTAGLTAAALFGVPDASGDLATMVPGLAVDDDATSPYIVLSFDDDSDGDGLADEIRCGAYRFDEPPTSGPGSRGRDDRHRGHVTVLKAIDKSTPLLYQALSTDRVFDGVTVTLSSGEGEKATPYFTHRLERCRVSSIRCGQVAPESYEWVELEFDRCVLDHADHAVRPIRMP